MASEKLSAITAATAAAGDELYAIRAGARKRLSAEDIADISLSQASERTRQHNFNATTLTALGADSAINGAFAADTDWTKGTGWTIGSGVASSDGTQTGDSDLENVGNAPVSGNVYEIEYTVSNYSAGNVVALIGGQPGTAQSANGTYTELVTASNTDILKMRGDLDFVGDIDDVSMKLANVSIDMDLAEVSKLTLDQNLVIDNPTNMVDGGDYILHLFQDGTGSRTVTWGSAYEWPGGIAPTLETTATTGHDIFRFVCDGNSMFGQLVSADSLSASYNNQTGTTYTIAASDNGKIITFDNAASIAVTLPDTLDTNFQCTIIQVGAGVPTVTPDTDTINGAGAGVTPAAQWRGMYLSQYSATNWQIGRAACRERV